MKEQLLQLLRDHAQWAFVISMLVSITVAILGIVPSFFVTAANILFFGFAEGVMISFLGEAVGAMVAFLLYRNGFKKMNTANLQRYPLIRKLLLAEKREAFLIILSFRLLPFIPSGIVTFGAAAGRVSATIFFMASSLGKLPSLVLEGYSVYQVTRFGWQGKIILIIVALLVLAYSIKMFQSKRT